MKGTGHVAIHLSRYKGIEKVVRLRKGNKTPIRNEKKLFSNKIYVNVWNSENMLWPVK